MNNLRLRHVEENDIELIFNWSNEKEVRKNSFHTEPIKWEEHVNWFKKVINDTNVCFFILENNEKPIGQIRIKFDDENKGIISFSISKEFRGLGFGKEILKLTEAEISKKCKLIGFVKIDNIASQRAFIINEYKKVKQDKKSIEYAKDI